MKKKLLLVFAFSLAYLAATPAQEIVTLTTPIAKPATANCQLEEFHLYRATPFANSRIVVDLACNNGDRVSKQWDQFTTPTGASLLTTMNRSNNAVGQTSFIAKVYNRLIADGVITGTVSGAVQ